jgi:hypothetical protein
MTDSTTNQKTTDGKKTDPMVIDLNKLKTPNTGKTIKDFQIPKYMLTDDKELVVLIMKSESMNDGERQYWFDLTKTMNMQQVEKLRDILTRERDKLAEIEAKYGTSKTKKPSATEIQKRNTEMEKQWQKKKAALAAREAAAESEENEEDILAGLDDL